MQWKLVFPFRAGSILPLQVNDIADLEVILNPQVAPSLMVSWAPDMLERMFGDNPTMH